MNAFGVAIRLPSLSAIKEHPGVTLMLASSLVSMTRWADAWTNAAGFKITGDLWSHFHTASGVGLAVIEPLAVFYCARALSRSHRSIASISLLTMLIVSVLCLFVIGTPVVISGMDGVMVREVLVDQWQRVVWGGAITLSNLLLLAAAGIADHLNSLKVRVKVMPVEVKAIPHKGDRNSRISTKSVPQLSTSTVLTELTDENFIRVYNETPEDERSTRKLAKKFTKYGRVVSHMTMGVYIKRLVKGE